MLLLVISCNPHLPDRYYTPSRSHLHRPPHTTQCNPDQTTGITGDHEKTTRVHRSWGRREAEGVGRGRKTGNFLSREDSDSGSGSRPSQLTLRRQENRQDNDSNDNNNGKAIPGKAMVGCGVRGGGKGKGRGEDDAFLFMNTLPNVAEEEGQAGLDEAFHRRSQGEDDGARDVGGGGGRCVNTQGRGENVLNCCLP